MANADAPRHGLTRSDTARAVIYEQLRAELSGAAAHDPGPSAEAQVCECGIPECLIPVPDEVHGRSAGEEAGAA